MNIRVRHWITTKINAESFQTSMENKIKYKTKQTTIYIPAPLCQTYMFFDLQGWHDMETFSACLGPLVGGFLLHRASNVDRWCFLWTIELPVISDAVTLTWNHCKCKLWLKIRTTVPSISRWMHDLRIVGRFMSMSCRSSHKEFEQNGCHFANDAFKCIFVKEKKKLILIDISLKLTPFRKSIFLRVWR